MTSQRVVAWAVLVVCLTTVAEERTDNEARHEEERALAHLGLGDPALVVAWNELINEIAFAEDQFLTFKGVRAHAMMHLAMHDALNAVVRCIGNSHYATLNCSPIRSPPRHSSPRCDRLAVSGSAGEERNAELARWISASPDGLIRARGIALGRRSAAAILATRIGDRWDFPGTYTFSTGPGVYQTTPPFNGFVIQPGFRFAVPFGLRSPAQFRPGPPPRLTSPDYAVAYNEVKDFGRDGSVRRTTEQTLYAVWWMLEFAEGSVNRLARQLVTQRSIQLWQAARMFALLNMSLFDAYVAVWDSKYEYNHWRPYTAIREAAGDGNPATAAEANWEPLRTTPPFPEYVSAHAAGCAGSFETLKNTFGDHVSFTMATTTAPLEMPSRSFRSFSAAAAECGDSRVRLGWHYRYATDAGVALGSAVADWLDKNHLEFRASPRR